GPMVHGHGNNNSKTHVHGTMNHVSLRVSVSNASGERTGVSPPVQEPESYAISFTKIPESHIQRIVKHYDAALLEDYFRDLLRAKPRPWAKDCDTDRNQLAALFHHVAKLTEIRRQTNDPIKIPGAMISRKWQKRNQPGGRLDVTTADEEFASELRRKSIVSQRSHHSVIPPSLATSAAVAAFGE
ncbi:MAG TPA: hypothetical protein PK992_09915, partial [Planctomycetaceae bacterium]|nr:hypothetical protein [Planctomycetaceae bacterium]